MIKKESLFLFRWLNSIYMLEGQFNAKSVKNQNKEFGINWLAGLTACQPLLGYFMPVYE